MRKRKHLTAPLRRGSSPEIPGVAAAVAIVVGMDTALGKDWFQWEGKT